MTISSKGISLRPSTCQIFGDPRLQLHALSRPARPTWRSSSRTSGRGPTRLISPLKSIDQLRELPSREWLRRKRPTLGDPRVVGDLEHAGIASRGEVLVEMREAGALILGVRDHRPELEDPERPLRCSPSATA